MVHVLWKKFVEKVHITFDNYKGTLPLIIVNNLLILIL